MSHILVSNQQNIGIVGAGIMGRLLAWRLMQSGHKVTLFDKDPIEQGNAAAYTAAGMLTPFAEIESAELLIFQMGMRSLQLWPEWLKMFNAEVGFYQKGSLVISHAQDKADLLRFNQQLNYKLAQDEQVKVRLVEEMERPRQISHDELFELEPEVASRFHEATWLPQEAWLCTKCVMKTLAERLLEEGASWYAHKAIEQLGENFVQFGRQRLEFDRVIDCRGLGARETVKGLRGVRGELLLLEAPDVNISRLVRLMHPRYRLYLVPKGRDNLYTIGATQIESDDMGPLTVRSALELLTAAYSLHPGFSEARIVESKTNCRPALSNNLPQVRKSNGVLQINGLYRHGFLLAPAIAEEVCRYIDQGDDAKSAFESLFQFESFQENFV
ncbi:glycine oxidase ThiO [Aliikangiella sp. G2MR2-5]|uniref:glycine oxidase ThiO n=1 Tax=Aliikangiella sp. G2MR2-5 TaxID=2788943 RepID=UPI0018A93F56|nr:glycine oxidase ThiO [Aliikangiella sp. G2MR2-5]